MSAVAVERGVVPPWLRGWVVPLLLVAVWDVLTRFKLVNTLLLARPSAVAFDAMG